RKLSTLSCHEANISLPVARNVLSCGEDLGGAILKLSLSLLLYSLGEYNQANVNLHDRGASAR
ncbi:MAG: hypothetical protein ACXWDO_11455, partial [Bacteroidia bacterium]